jgi:hypothetical protein
MNNSGLVSFSKNNSRFCWVSGQRFAGNYHSTKIPSEVILQWGTHCFQAMAIELLQSKENSRPGKK